MAVRQKFEHFHGWAADLLVSLDIIDAGLLGVVARTSSARRQAVMCVLAYVGEAALARLDTFGQPILCDEVIALQPIARDLRKLPTPALLTRYVPGADEMLRLTLAEMTGVRPPQHYRELARQWRAASDPSLSEAGLAATTSDIAPLTTSPGATN